MLAKGKDYFYYDVIVCGNDHIAILTYQLLLSQGFRIPKDVAVVRYDIKNGRDLRENRRDEDICFYSRGAQLFYRRDPCGYGARTRLQRAAQFFVYHAQTHAYADVWHGLQ